MGKYIAIVDYGAGNLMSVANALSFLGYEGRIVCGTEELEQAGAVILPGVGAFPDAMECLRNSKIEQMLKEQAAKKPLLGICLGAQMLFDRSDEITSCVGLGLIQGEVSRIKTSLKLPHMGWNSLDIINPNPLTKGLSGGEYVYFVHSYMAYPEHGENITATVGYDLPVTAMVHKGSVFGCQFHPEKSGEAGLTILRNFARLMD